MSFNVTSTAVTIFCEGFYTALILNCRGFDEAVGYGRMALYQRQHRGRISISDSILAQTYAQYPQSQRRSVQTRDLRPGFARFLRTAFYYTRQCFDRFSARWSHLTSPLPDLVNKYTPLYPALQSLGFDIGKIQYHRIVKLDIRMMHLEDRLKQIGSLYIWGPPKARNAELIRIMAHMWILTNFVDCVHVVNASQFLESSFQTWLRRLWISIWGDTNALRRESASSRSKDYRKGTKRQLFVIEDVDQLYATNFKPSATKDAEQRLQNFYEKLDLENSFLIIIGRDEDWMRLRQWGGEIEEFNHNRPFPSSSKYNI